MNTTHVVAMAVVLSTGAALSGVAGAQSIEPRPLGRTVVTEAGTPQQALRPGMLTRAAVVGFADLDLTRSPGVDVLYRRLGHAADQVCAPAEARQLVQRRLWRECRTDALDRAVMAVGHATLINRHLAATGRSVGGISADAIAARSD